MAALLWPWPINVRCGEVPHESLSDGSAEEGLAVADRAEGPADLPAVGALQQVTAGAGSHGGEDRLVVFEHGQHQDADVRAGLSEQPGGLDTVETGHM